MSADWFCTVAVWGDWYADRWINDALPSHRAALDRMPWPVRHIVHTDRPKVLAAAMEGIDVEFREVPPADHAHGRFQAAAREAVQSIPAGSRILLLNADIVVSRETFAACALHFHDGFEAVVCAGTRTFPREPVPAGASAPELLDWTIRNRHPIIDDLFWPEGRGRTPWCVYFRQGEHVTLRAWHLHPLAVIVPPAVLDWVGSPDLDMLDTFDRAKIHVVTARDDLALAEISPADKTFGRLERAMRPESLADWATTHASPLHRWNAQHRIIIQGAGETDDEAAWARITPLLGPYEPRAPRSPLARRLRRR